MGPDPSKRNHIFGRGIRVPVLLSTSLLYAMFNFYQKNGVVKETVIYPIIVSLCCWVFTLECVGDL